MMRALGTEARRLALFAAISVVPACSNLSGLEGGSADSGPGDHSTGENAGPPDATPPPDGATADGKSLEAGAGDAQSPADAPPCAKGYATCAARPGQCTTNVFNDGANCGACGHDCEGGGCLDAVCQPTIVAQGEANALGLVADNTNLYWGSQSNSGYVKECALAGCNLQPTVLAAQIGPVSGVAVDDSNLYWTTDSGVVATCSKAGCSIVAVLASGENIPFGLVTDAASLYWSTLSPQGMVRTCPKPNCAGGPTTVASAQYPTGPSLDATRVYWGAATNQGGIVQVIPKMGSAGQITTLATTITAISNTVVDDTTVYFSDTFSGSILSCFDTGCNNMPGTLATGQMSNESFATDGMYLYWATNIPGGAVLRCAKSGCGGQPTVVAAQQNHPQGLVVLATRLFWTNTGDGTIMKLVR